MDEISLLNSSDFPPLLSEINDPPEKLFFRGKLPDYDKKFLCVVGSRKVSSYGREVCEKLIRGLKGYPIVIVSGLALGTDALAHRAALDAKLDTVAIPGSGLSDKALHPKTNFRLALEILKSGGALISEFKPDFRPTIWSFPKRNRIMAGISHATLIVEAGEKSGTLITARLSMEYNREVMVVPGPIFYKGHAGSNKLLVDGATPVTSSEDILEALGIEKKDERSKTKEESLSEDEKRIVEILEAEPLAKDDLINELEMSVTEANILLSTMEIKGLIEERMGKIKIS